MESRYRILAVSGSLQARSANRTLLEFVQASAGEAGEVRLFEGLRALPAFDPDLADSELPDAVNAWRRALAESDGVLIACPEYGFSLPGALKNAIDWVIGTGELEGKVVAAEAALPWTAQQLLEDATAVTLEYKDSAQHRGCFCFSTAQNEIVSDREYQRRQSRPRSRSSEASAFPRFSSGSVPVEW